MSELTIYELDPMRGHCGLPAEIPGLPPVDMMREELIRQSRVVNQLKKQLKIEINRNFLRNAGDADNPIVKSFVEKHGVKAFPVFLYGDTILHSGSFPAFEELAEKISEIEHSK
jgi:Arsenical resistance operon protein ArsD